MNETPAATFMAYGNNQSEAAIAARKELPPELQLALFDIIDELCADPRRRQERLRPISRDGKVMVYKHPAPSLEVTFEIDDDEHQLYFMHYAAIAVTVRKKVFVSYSHEDQEWLEKLSKWLKPLEKAGILDVWDDRKIQPGA
ncbi:MAG: hypothetical protein GWN84_22490, partial [Gammaproteobacteria bacterium]|nr:hypothetical protein [Gammaproteobacteria bacterium]NIR85407.1 hypothetical protein [Gammaproteobacteria bacterium]NIR89074.1 hypothetical protein [Gammaproteobacteria bacterium]NIU06537.1 hypothetical protein [Gammaproteobacteria bacterium]NIV53426.1 hypothetical protein [Gammaproteobacteria bacterium]